MRAVTREETTAVSVDVELYEGQLSRVGPTDKHTVVCHEVTKYSIEHIDVRFEA